MPNITRFPIVVENVSSPSVELLTVIAMVNNISAQAEPSVERIKAISRDSQRTAAPATLKPLCVQRPLHNRRGQRSRDMMAPLRPVEAEPCQGLSRTDVRYRHPDVIEEGLASQSGRNGLVPNLQHIERSQAVGHKYTELARDMIVTTACPSRVGAESIISGQVTSGRKNSQPFQCFGDPCTRDPVIHIPTAAQ